MTSLTRIAYYTRKGVILGIAGIVFFLILKATLGIGINYWKKAHPAPTPTPNVLFGKLKKIDFPSSDHSHPEQIALETVGGEIPEASSTAKIYQIPKKLPSLLSARNARNFATNLGFKGNPISQKPTEYKFEDPITPLKTLDLNIVTNNFFLKYDYLKDPLVFKEGGIPGKEEAKKQAIDFFQTTGVFPAELQEGEKKLTLLRFENGELLPATSLSKAEAVRVDFLRNKVGEYSLLPAGYDESSVYVVFSGSQEKEKRIIEASFTFFEVDYQTWATYPIKTPQTAWEEFKNGQGYVARWTKGLRQTTVRNFYLAYYDPPQYQPFLLPIFVFEGDEKFVGYLNAVKKDWIE